MRLIFILTLLAFPVAEIWLLMSLADQYGWWVLLYLVVVTVLGLRLIRDEKLLFSVRMMQSLTQGNNPLKAMFGSARNIIAGILLIIPGMLTDMIAVILLLMPIKHAPVKTATYQAKQAANDEVIEGEFRRED